MKSLYAALVLTFAIITLGTSESRASDNWSYKASEDKMTSEKTYFAQTQSLNTLNFDFPYSGSQNAILTLRTHPRHGKDIMVSIDKGQFLCTSYDGCKVLIRFDEDKAKTYDAMGASDNSTTVIFIKNYSGFAAKMLKARKVLIQAEFYQEGAQILEFDVSGFDINKYRPK